MRQTCLLLLSGVLLLSGCGSGGGSSSDPGAGGWVIQGVVVCRDPALTSVRVVLSGAVETSTTTDASGRFRFEGVPNGSYRVVPVAGGCDFAPDFYDLYVAGEQPPSIQFERNDLTDPKEPAEAVRLVLVHHEAGDALLHRYEGNLAANLAHQNYFVRNVSYGWDAPENPDIGDHTGIGSYWTWFADTTAQSNGMARRDNILQALYTTDAKSGTYPSPLSDPGGENDVILIMSPCENSAVQDDNATTSADLRGQAQIGSAHTLPNCKALYRDVLAHMRTRPDKLFVLLTAPPLAAALTTEAEASNARALNDWLVFEWLQEADWQDRNVYVWDLFNVLTDVDNHHRYSLGQVVHEQVGLSNTAAYATGPGDSTPDPDGSFKATSELIGILNISYNRWQHWYTTP